MFLLDTHVISELRKARAGKADPTVAAWVRTVPPASLFLSAMVILELEIGTLLAERRDPSKGAILRAWLNDHVLPSFSERILPIDTAVARRSAALHIPDPRPIRDALIAATALTHGMTVVTRNVADFELTGVQILNPWVAKGMKHGLKKS
jgi:predicted nucleic acid-binding protein